MRSRLVALIVLLTALSAAAPPARAALPPIRHVWVIQLENHSYDQTFNDATHPYLWNTLRKIGVVLPNYYATGHVSLDNYIAQISGQAPNLTTNSDCQVYTDVLPGIMGPDGQVVGQGCVYPATAKTLVDQLETKGLTWKGYMEDMGNDPSREAGTCGAPPMNQRDPTQSATATDQYAARHNPFVYFHSILDVPGRCQAHVVSLAPLQADLQSAATTPNFSWITPNLCNDGHDATPCAGTNAKGTKEGDLIAADAFLAKWVPVITGSPAFQQDGLLVITLDESSVSDSSACCNEPAGLNTVFPGISGPGGGRTGTILVSPFIRPGTVDQKAYNHYSFLRSMEDLFGISEHLGYAGMAGLSSFGGDVFNRPAGGRVPAVPPLPAHDAGSTGQAEPLRVAILGRRGRLVRVRLTGSDRLVTPVVAVLKRGGRVVTSSGAPRTLPGGRGTLRLRRHAGRGRYTLEVRAVHEDEVVARVRRALIVHHSVV